MSGFPKGSYNPLSRILKAPSLLPPKALINRSSQGTPGAIPVPISGEVILSGALVANTWKPVLSVTGKGTISTLLAATQDTTSRTIGLRVTIDGVVVYTSITSAITASQNGVAAIGTVSYFSGSPTLSDQSVPFTNSFQVELQSSLSETDKVGAQIAYRTV